MHDIGHHLENIDPLSYTDPPKLNTVRYTKCKNTFISITKVCKFWEALKLLVAHTSVLRF